MPAPARPAYQQRVIQELGELRGNLGRLETWLGQPTILNLIDPSDRVYALQEYARLSAQLALMAAYAGVLENRIRNFKAM